MANTFSKIYLQFVFSVKNRNTSSPKEHKEELQSSLVGS
ncbi:hypothetical protein BH10BAC3_BH10BAC3_43100 [soil metagenome]